MTIFRHIIRKVWFKRCPLCHSQLERIPYVETTDGFILNTIAHQQYFHEKPIKKRFLALSCTGCGERYSHHF